MSAAITCRDLGRRYGRRWALRDCTLEIPAGRVAGLVGPNGSGKTTLMHMAVGLLAPSTGTIEILGRPAGGSAAQLSQVGFVAQDTPAYENLTIEDHLRLGARLNSRWDAGLAHRRIGELELDLHQRAGRLSGGQRAQLALTMAIAKRPELLLLDEPVASLDPLARRQFMQSLMEITADHEIAVVISSHLVADLERICDYLVLLTSSRVRLAGDVEDLLATHRRIVGPRESIALPPQVEVIEESHTDRQSTLIVHVKGPVYDPAWTVEELGLEDVVLAYMRQAARTPEQRAPRLLSEVAA